MKEITPEKIQKYLETTKKALSRVMLNNNLDADNKRIADEFLDMAQRYYKDAEFYKKKDDFVTAFAAVNYAHGWIDAGVRAGLLIAPKGTEDFIMPKE